MTKRKIKAKALNFLSDGHTWKLVEVAHGILCPYEELLPALVELEAEGKIDLGGYESDPDHWKFVRLHTDRMPGMEHILGEEAVTRN